MKIIVIGAGGHAKVILEALLASGAEVIGLTEAQEDLATKYVLGCKILGSDNVLSNYNPTSTMLVLGIGGSTKLSHRQTLIQRFRKQGFGFHTILHPTAIIARDAKLSQGVQIMAGSIIQPSVLIGENSIVNTGVCVEHDCQIGQNSHIAPGAVLTGGVIIGSNVFIGAGAVIGNGIAIGDHSIVGMGAAVTKNVSSHTKVAGVPALPIKDHGGTAN